MEVYTITSQYTPIQGSRHLFYEYKPHKLYCLNISNHLCIYVVLRLNILFKSNKEQSAIMYPPKPARHTFFHLVVGPIMDMKDVVSLARFSTLTLFP